MPPDPITAYLASRGATPSAANANRVREFYAPNPDLLDRRALGLPGGLDDNSAVLDAMLDKHIAESMPSPGVNMAPQSDVPPPSRTAPTAKGKGEVGGTNTAKAGVPTASPNKQGTQYGPGTENAPVDNNEYVSVLGNANDPHASTMGGDLGKWLLGLLAGGAGVAAMSKMGGKSAAPAPTAGAVPGMTLPGGIPMDSTPPGVGPNAAPAPYSTDLRTPATNNPVAGQTIVPEENAARNDMNKERIQREVEMENDAMMRKMADEEAARRRQSNTRETLNAAKRTVRGR